MILIYSSCIWGVQIYCLILVIFDFCLIQAGRESAELQNEIEALEKQGVLCSMFEANLAEVQKQYRDKSAHELLSGMLNLNLSCKWLVDY